MSIHLHTRPQLQPQGPAISPPAAQVHPMPLAAPARPPFIRRALVTGAQTSLVVGVLLFGTMFAMERLAPERWKPSTMLGAFGGNQEYAHIATSLEAKRAEAAALQQEIARAQQEIIAVQAANDRVTKAYEALYQRGNLMAQQWAQGAVQALLVTLETKRTTLEGKRNNAEVMDKLALMCSGLAHLWWPQIREKCQALRDGAQAERDEVEDELAGTYKRQSAAIAASLRGWSQGLPDPAEMVVLQATARDMALQAAPRPAPPPSPIYPRADSAAQAGL